MSTRKLRIAAAALALLAALAPAAFGQEPAQQQQPVDNSVNHTSFQGRVFEVRNRDPESLLSVLRLLTSGHKGANVSADRNFRTITVRDFPENVASIQDAIKRLDTPEGARPEVELRMHVLIASNGEGATGQFPADLKEVVNQLQTTLNFKNYQLLTTLLQRTKERPGYSPGFINGEGSAQTTLPGTSAPAVFRYNYQAAALTLTTAPAGGTTLQVGGFNFHLDGGEAGKATIRSDVGLRENERVVVGTAGLRDRALILVLTARLIK